MKFTVSVVTISDSAFGDASVDRSGPVIKDMLERTANFTSQDTIIVPDDPSVIQESIIRLSGKDQVDWIITTGGTGFGPRDHTPEAVSSLLERQAPGLVHLLLSSSLVKTPFAALGRPVAGTRGKTLIVTLPGSPRAVKENMEVLLSGGVVEHALDLLRGGRGEQLHAILQSRSEPSVNPPRGHLHQAPHARHDHEHGAHREPEAHTAPRSHDPSFPVTSRLRHSPYPLVPFDQAIAIVLRNSTKLDIVRKPVNSLLRGHVLAEDVTAPHDIPLSVTTSVDGYAMHSGDPPGVYRVLTPQTHDRSQPLPEGCVYRINTGAPLPAHTDAIIMVEDTTIQSCVQNDKGEDIEEREVRTLVSVSSGENARLPGSDVTAGETVMSKGYIIGSIGGEIGTLAFVGRREVLVYRKPVVALMSTGNEIKDLHSSEALSHGSDGWSGIWDTNRPALQAAIEGLGYHVVDLGIVKDDVDAHAVTMRTGLTNADVLITTGGSSMGSTDLLKPVIERNLAGVIHFGRVLVKPGKPTTFATVSLDGSVPKPVFGLPGNPASALVCFYLFVVPALRRLGGWPESKAQLPRVQVELNDGMSLDPRPEFHRVHIRRNQGNLRAFSTGGQRSSRVVSVRGANGLVVLPPLQPNGRTRLEAGERVDAIVIGELEESDI